MAEPPAAPSRSTLQTTAPLNIVMATPEAVPFAKTGGLGDVASALPLELAKLGHDIRLVIPRYGFIKGAAYEFKEYERLTVPTFAGPVPAVVEQGVLAGGPGRSVRVPVLAIRSDPYFDRPGLYQVGGADYPDNLERFAFFSRAVLELLIVLREREGWGTEVLHIHDWQTALCPIYLRTVYADRPALRTVSSLLTLHNLGFQGIFPGADYPKTLLPPELFTPKILEFYGSLNLLKGGLLFADYLNTVSPTYGREIQTAEFGFGLEGVIRERRERLSGVVNGIDTEVWNPAQDPHLPARYSSLDLSGKAECKTALQREVGLPVRNVPVLVMVSRLTAQKGLDHVAEINPELMELDLQLIVLGTG
ncbi:MAG: glycogen synthase, partial [Nitrospirales bacterium]